MKIPERPPDVRYIVETKPDFPAEAFKGILAHLNDENRAFLRRVNEEQYLPWPQLKHIVRPAALSPELAWIYTKMARIADAQPLPLLDADGRAFTFNVPEAVARTLHEIDRDAPRRIETDYPFASGDRERFVMNSLMEEAIASSQIEGAATTRIVAKEMLRTGRPPVGRGERMILNNYRAMQEIRRVKDEPLSVDLLFRLHRILMRDAINDPEAVGRLRRPDEDVRVVDESDRTVLFTPPAAQSLPERLEKLCAFANQEDGPFIHPVVRAVILHFALAYEHPFVDGNGRTARALFYWYLIRKGYWLFEFVPVSRILLRAKIKYGRAFLYSEHDDGDLTYFIFHNARVIRRALIELHDYLTRKAGEKAAAQELLVSVPGLNERQAQLLAEAVRGGRRGEGTLSVPAGRRVHTIDEHARAFSVTYHTARADLLGLVREGWFTSVKRGKRLWFAAKKDAAERVGSV